MHFVGCRLFVLLAVGWLSVCVVGCKTPTPIVSEAWVANVEWPDAAVEEYLVLIHSQEEFGGRALYDCPSEELEVDLDPRGCLTTSWGALLDRIDELQADACATQPADTISEFCTLEEPEP